MKIGEAFAEPSCRFFISVVDMHIKILGLSSKYLIAVPLWTQILEHERSSSISLNTSVL